MPPFVDKLLRPWILSTPELYERYRDFIEDNAMDGKEDPFGKLAMKMMFFQVVLPSPQLRAEYERMHHDFMYTPDVELIGQLRKLLYQYGWHRFFIAIRLMVRSLYTKHSETTVNGRRIKKSLEFLDEVPHNVDL